MTNIKPIPKKAAVRPLATLFQALGQPTRLKILLAIGRGEACVCHLESVLKVRQATISQHLMTLREVGLVDSRRDGRNIFYRLADPALLDLLEDAADLAGLAPADLPVGPAEGVHLAACICPTCEAARETVPTPLKE